MKYSAWLQGVLADKSLDRIKSDFLHSGYTQSTLTKGVIKSAHEAPNLEDCSGFEAVNRASFDLCAHWTDYWSRDCHPEVHLSMPVLVIDDEWVEKRQDLPHIRITMTSKQGSYNPVFFVGAVRRDDVPDETVRRLGRRAGWISCYFEGHGRSCWLFWVRGGVDFVLGRLATAYIQMSSTQQTLFLAQLAHHLSLCIDEHYDIISERPILAVDSRLVALNDLQHQVTGQLAHLLMVNKKHTSHDRFIENLIEMSKYYQCELELCYSCAWMLWLFETNVQQ